MRKTPCLMLLCLGLGVLPSAAAILETYAFSDLNQTIPDGNVSGVSLAADINSQILSITSVQVGLNLTSDSNGSLYGYLSHNGQLCVLLNRVGRTDANLAGYDDHGVNITFDDSLLNRDIHLYNTIAPPLAGQPLTGSWQTDARHIDPDQALDTTPRNADLSVFNSGNANGQWTLFLASLESGSATTLNSWSLTITGVPEPQTYACATGLLLLCFAIYRKSRQ